MNYTTAEAEIAAIISSLNIWRIDLTKPIGHEMRVTVIV